MDYIRGRIFSESIPKNVKPDELRQIYNSLNEVLQKIHSVDVEKAGLQDYGKPGMIRSIFFSKQSFRSISIRIGRLGGQIA